MLSFSISKYKEDKKIVKEEEVENVYIQNIRLLEILKKQITGKPIIIFAKTTKLMKLLLLVMFVTVICLAFILKII